VWNTSYIGSPAKPVFGISRYSGGTTSIRYVSVSGYLLTDFKKSVFLADKYFR
jgi:hypothetical protein